VTSEDAFVEGMKKWNYMLQENLIKLIHRGLKVDYLIVGITLFLF